MTDREMLIHTRDEIAAYLVANPEMEGVYQMRPNGRATETPKGFFSGWVNPCPIYGKKVPVISDDFNRYAIGEPGDDDYQRQHLGVDICFKNDAPREPNPPEWSKWFHMPSNTVPYLAPGPAHVWFAGKTTTGWTVKLDHHGWVGFPLITYHTHLSELFIDEWDDGPGGLYVPAGFQLGYIGNTPKNDDDINHVHFEMWDYTEGVPSGRVNRALDPKPYVGCFGHRVIAA